MTLSQRITTKIGYRYVASMLLLFSFIYVMQATSVTLTVNSHDEIIAVDGVPCDPVISYGMMEDAGEIIYDRN